MAQNLFFCFSSKTSEKTAHFQKKVQQNPQRSARCRYERKKKEEKKVKPRIRIFFGSAKVAPDCNPCASNGGSDVEIRPLGADLVTSETPEFPEKRGFL